MSIKRKCFHDKLLFLPSIFPKEKNNKIIFNILFLTIFFFHQLIFQNYLIINGKLNGDYILSVPAAIFGKIWFLKNGLFEIPYFNASTCCGIPFYADPQSAYYSLTQFLFLIFDVDLAIRILFLALSIIAFLGTYILTRFCFKFEKYNSLLCASLFLFNGFFVYRFLWGHLQYCYYVFVPLYCFFIIQSSILKNNKLKILFFLISTLIIANFFHSGVAPIMPIIILSIVSVIIIYLLNNKNYQVIKYTIVSFFIGVLISLSKIVSSLYFLKQYPRVVEGIYLNNILDFIYVFFTSFFIYPHTSYFHRNNLNNIFNATVDLDFSISLVPLIILVLFIFHFKRFINKKNYDLYVILFLVLAVPIFFNVNIFNSKYIISNIPIFKSFWINTRWMAVYIFPIILFVGIVIDALKLKNSFILLLIFLILFQTVTYHKIRNFLNTNYFVNGSVYSISTINNYSKNLKEKINEVKIENVKMFSDFTENEGFMNNTSNYYCYSPIFGYRLEHLPFNNIKNFQEPKKDLVNYLFNPVCFLYGDQNFCRPGDLFKPSEALDLYQFINFNNYYFDIPFYQKISNYISLITFIIVSSVILILFIVLIITKILLTKNKIHIKY
jgi:hypothetical protein